MLLERLASVATESRREYMDAVDAIDIFDARRERSAEMNLRVSCSDMGEGPGTGGRGDKGGPESGGFGLGRGLGSLAESGVLGIWVGGTGKDERSRGTALRFPVDMAGKGGWWNEWAVGGGDYQMIADANIRVNEAANNCRRDDAVDNTRARGLGRRKDRWRCSRGGETERERRE